MLIIIIFVRIIFLFVFLDYVKVTVPFVIATKFFFSFLLLFVCCFVLFLLQLFGGIFVIGSATPGVYHFGVIGAWINFRYVIRTHLSKLFYEWESLILDFMFTYPEFAIFREILSINCHFDNLSICLEPLENIYIKVFSIVNMCKIFPLLLRFPFTEQYLVIKDALGRYSIKLLLYWLPCMLW